MTRRNKFDRIQKRKAERAAEAKDRINATKEQQRRREKRATWRRDSRGNIIFMGAIRIGPVAIAMMIGIIAVVVFFAVLVITNTEETGICANPFCKFFDGSLFAPPPEKQIFAPPEEIP